MSLLAYSLWILVFSSALCYLRLVLNASVCFSYLMSRLCYFLSCIFCCNCCVRFNYFICVRGFFFKFIMTSCSRWFLVSAGSSYIKPLLLVDFVLVLGKRWPLYLSPNIWWPFGSRIETGCDFFLARPVCFRIAIVSSIYCESFSYCVELLFSSTILNLSIKYSVYIF